MGQVISFLKDPNTGLFSGESQMNNQTSAFKNAYRIKLKNKNAHLYAMSPIYIDPNTNTPIYAFVDKDSLDANINQDKDMFYKTAYFWDKYGSPDYAMERGDNNQYNIVDSNNNKVKEFEDIKSNVIQIDKDWCYDIEPCPPGITCCYNKTTVNDTNTQEIINNTPLYKVRATLPTLQQSMVIDTPLSTNSPTIEESYMITQPPIMTTLSPIMTTQSPIPITTQVPIVMTTQQPKPLITQIPPEIIEKPIITVLPHKSETSKINYIIIILMIILMLVFGYIYFVRNNNNNFNK